jgi:hypothetical protein
MYDKSLTRPTNIEELNELLGKFWNDEALEKGLAFKPRPSDIIISPFTKCGTTLLQQITHGLRTRGSMDFDEISEVTPWIEVAYDVGWDLEAEQETQPRLYKSHANWYEIPKGGRYICSFRHPHTAMVSLYRFFEGYFFEPKTITMDELIEWRAPRENVETSGYWHHLSSWWEQRDNANVLLLCYENIIADLPGAIMKIAKFMEISLDDQLLDIVSRQSSREFMLQHTEKYDSHHIVEVGSKRSGLPPVLDSNKVTPGTPDIPRYQLSEESKAWLDEIWHTVITKRHGLKDYEDLRNVLAKNSQR